MGSRRPPNTVPSTPSVKFGLAPPTTQPSAVACLATLLLVVSCTGLLGGEQDARTVAPAAQDGQAVQPPPNDAGPIPPTPDAGDPTSDGTPVPRDGQAVQPPPNDAGAITPAPDARNPASDGASCSLIAIAASSITSAGGSAYYVGGSFGTPADNSSAAGRSTLRLFEDGAEMGPAHTPHADISSLGLGRFSHWSWPDGSGEALRFSASDNGDPRTNGRTYGYCTPAPPAPTPTTAAVEGFAAVAGVTGGAGGQDLRVTNLNNSGPGSLRQAVQYSVGPRTVSFAPGLTGTITLQGGYLHVEDGDLTIDGIGVDITISGEPLFIFKSNNDPVSNIIIKNLSFKNTRAEVSAISIWRGSKNIWIDHNTFSNNSTGNIGEPIDIWHRDELGDAFSGITISWNHFLAPNKKAVLVGSNSNYTKKSTRVSMHHNWFDGVTARNPRIHSGALVHVWNNYISGWGEYGIGSSYVADVFVENNIFENGANSNAVLASYGGPQSSSVNASGNLVLGPGVIETIGTFPSDKITYVAEKEVANAALKAKIMNGAGANKTAPSGANAATFFRTIHLIGDSTMATYDSSRAPLTGWGMPFSKYYREKSLEVNNWAVSGASSRDWTTTHWAPIHRILETGDYVLISLGHNDAGAQNVSTAEYVSNLQSMVAQTQAKGAIPVLITPTTYRRFDATGSLPETHPRTAAAMRTLASSIGVALIDLDALSRALVRSYGVEGSKQLYLYTSAGEYPAYPNGSSDNTHFQQLGAQKMSDLVASEIARLDLEGLR